jgi:hypothetical protein
MTMSQTNEQDSTDWEFVREVHDLIRNHHQAQGAGLTLAREIKARADVFVSQIQSRIRVDDPLFYVRDRSEKIHKEMYKCREMLEMALSDGRTRNLPVQDLNELKNVLGILGQNSR